MKIVCKRIVLTLLSLLIVFPSIWIAQPVEATVNKLCMFYYGGHSSTSISRIVAAAPQFLVMNTPAGMYHEQNPVQTYINAGIKVFSYVAVGRIEEYQYDPANPVDNTYSTIMSLIDAVAAEGDYGVFFDESAVNLNTGGSYSWSGHTIADAINRAHNDGLIVMLGIGDTNFNGNLWTATDYILTDEYYTNRAPVAVESGYESRCIVIGYGRTSAADATTDTEAAWTAGFGFAYQCESYGVMATWFETYIANIQGATSSQLFTSYVLNDTNYYVIENGTWVAQTFTPLASHTITDVSLPLLRAGSPGLVSVSIRATSGGVPTGSDVTSGTINGNNFTTSTSGQYYDIALTPYILTAGTVYAIVVRDPSGNAGLGNYIGWRKSVNSGYSGGGESDSLDSGATWSAVSAISDFLFMDYGLPLNASPPTVTTSAATGIGNTYATGHGNVTSDGGATILERGVCYNTSGSPTTSSTKTTTSGTTGAFSVSVVGLLNNTTYYMKAYAINAAGTSYGSQVSFATTNTGVPAVTTQAISSIQPTTATGNGTVTSDGGNTITSRGVCWNTSGSPTIADYTATTTGTTGAFTAAMTGLNPGTAYYVKAFATNSAGTSYGSQVTFSATNTVLTVSTEAVSAISTTTATGNGTIVTNGGATITEVGVVWNTTGTPTTSSSKATGTVTQSGAYTVAMSSLTAGVFYYVRAYAINSVGTAYGSQVTFSTITLPSVTTGAATNIGNTTVTGNGSVVSDGGSAIIERGVCWNTGGSPTTSDSKATTTGTTGGYVVSCSGLTANTTYYMKAYAINLAGTAYGNQVTFATTNVAVPIVTTQAVDGIYDVGATGHGTVLDAGGGTISARGVCWGATLNPTTSDSTAVAAGTTGIFAVTISGLTVSTTYHVRAYATNGTGTGYGADVTFTTVATPVVVTNSVRSQDATSAYLVGNITSLGGYTSVAVSFYYGTTTAYGGTTAPQTLAATGPFYFQVTGLRANTTYHYQAVGVFGSITYTGADVTFTTLYYPGSSTDLSITGVAAFQNYLSSGDILFTTEIVNKYTGYYPGASAGDFFTVELLGTNGTTILGASPLSAWGDRPSSIYFSPAAVTSQSLVVGASYSIALVSSLSGITTVTKALAISDWKGIDPRNLDEWCRGTAFAMGQSDSTTYVTASTDIGVQINDAGGGYFTTGIPGIAQVRPNLFTSSKSQVVFIKGTANNAFDASPKWSDQVGPKIANDFNTFGALFSTDANAGQMVLGWLLTAIVLIICVVGVGAGGKALGLVLLSIPIIMYGNYLRVIGIQVLVIPAIIMAWFFVRQFFWKTT